MVVPVARSRVLSVGLSVVMRMYCASAPEVTPNTAATRNRIVRNRLRMVSNLRRIEFMTESPRTSGRIPSAVPAPPGLRVLDEALDFLSPAPPAATRGMAAARQEPPSGDSTTFESLLDEDDLAGAASTAALDARVVHARCHIAAPLVLAAPADAIDAG